MDFLKQSSFGIKFSVKVREINAIDELERKITCEIVVKNWTPNVVIIKTIIEKIVSFFIKRIKLNRRK